MSDVFQIPEKFHLTLGVLRLFNREEKVKVYHPTGRAKMRTSLLVFNTVSSPLLANLLCCISRFLGAERAQVIRHAIMTLLSRTECYCSVNTGES